MKLLEKFTNIEALNFALTNRFPRRLVTLFFGWFSRIEHPVVVSTSLWIWRTFTHGLNLEEAAKQEFSSLHDCFIRELKPGARVVDDRQNVITSPCDAVVGEIGRLQDKIALQIKGAPYSIVDLLGDEARAREFADGLFITLRLKSTMYHRFHAPCDGSVDAINYISGDVWNVNPAALKRVPQLFCKNERVLLPITASLPEVRLMLVPVAAVLVASLQLHGLDYPLNLKYQGSNEIALQREFHKGDELGYFQHGSSIVILAKGPVSLAAGIRAGDTIRVGEALLDVTSPF